MRIALLAASLAAFLTVAAAGNGGPVQRAALPAKIIYVNVGQGDAVVMRPSPLNPLRLRIPRANAS